MLQVPTGLPVPPRIEMKHLIALSLLATLAPFAAAQTGSASATYRVTFDATWSSTTHPGAFPSSAHFSPLIGATHAPGTHLWQAGALASNGIEVMAETGSTSPLASEVSSLISSGLAGQIVTGPGAGSPDSVSATFTVTNAHSAVSLVTMIAPSPDWFVGVDAVDLWANGAWKDTVTASLPAYDSGTDSGVNFQSFNQNTNPAAPISMITDGPLGGLPALGTFTFTRVKSSVEYGTCDNPAGSLGIAAVPTIGQTAHFQVHDPIGPTSPAATLLAFSLAQAPGACGTPIPGWGLSAIDAPGALLIGDLLQYKAGPSWAGAPVPISVAIPALPSLAGLNVYAQAVLISDHPAGGIRFGATSGLHLTLGL